MHNKVANAQLDKAFVIFKLDSKQSGSTWKCQVHLHLVLEQLSKMYVLQSERVMMSFTKANEAAVLL